MSSLSLALPEWVGDPNEIVKEYLAKMPPKLLGDTIIGRAPHELVLCLALHRIVKFRKGEENISQNEHTKRVKLLSLIHAHKEYLLFEFAYEYSRYVTYRNLRSCGNMCNKVFDPFRN